MCRFFCYISSEPALVEDMLITPEHAITKQIAVHYLPKLLPHSDSTSEQTTQDQLNATNALINTDGFGCGIYSDTRSSFGEGNKPMPVVYKTLQPPKNDQNFISLAQNTASTCIFAHVRMATSIVHRENNHPFLFGQHLFQHNGELVGFQKIRRSMCDLMTNEAFETIRGSTDSEHIAALFFSFLGNFNDAFSLIDMKVALERTIATIEALQRKLMMSGEPQASSLNLAVTNGTELLCIRYRNHPFEQPPSLYFSTEAGPTLNRKYVDHPDGSVLAAKHEDKYGDMLKIKSEHASHVIVSSEPITYQEEEWELIKKNHLIMVDKNGQVNLQKANIDDVSESLASLSMKK